jgi:ribosomal protein S18 acetylase RimI-like enzyme
MFSSRTRKIILVLSSMVAVYSGMMLYRYHAPEQGPIYHFNPTRDTKEMMDIFHNDWYWLLASDESSPAFMLKHRTYDANPAHFGSMHIKVLREADGRLAGFTTYYMETPQQGRILFVAVVRDFRVKGYGKFLTNHAMQELFKLGANHIALWTRVSNLPAQRIYRELGFVEKFEENGYLFFEYWPSFAKASDFAKASSDTSAGTPS